MITQEDYLQRFKKVLAHTRQEVSALRTGRATVQMLDDVVVEAYGGRMKINEVGNISAPDAELLVVSPWDKSLISEIEKGIQQANLNLNPVVDGETIKVPVPSLTKERRQEMVKILHQRAESSRVMVRSVRTDVKQEIEEQQGEAGISEDDIQLTLKNLEETTKKYIDKIDALVKEKERELTSL
jgi:ribosome recycling factor